MNWTDDFGNLLIKTIINDNERLIRDSNKIQIAFHENIPEICVTNKDDIVLNIIKGDNALILWQLLTGVEIYKSNDELYDIMENLEVINGQSDK